MLFGLSGFTLFHTLLSLVALVAGIGVTSAFLASRKAPGWEALFLLTAVATSATGFGFPFAKFLPSHGVGAISLIVLLMAILARYVFGLAGAWRPIYVIGVVIAFYLDAFVAIVQAFLKIPALHALAPTQSEPPFLIAQVVALVVFVALAIAAAVRFKPPAA